MDENEINENLDSLLFFLKNESEAKNRTIGYLDSVFKNINVKILLRRLIDDDFIKQGSEVFTMKTKGISFEGYVKQAIKLKADRRIIDRNAKWSLPISIISLLMALIALVITVIYHKG